MNTLDTLEVVPSGAALGAEIRGVALTLPVSDAIAQALREAWYEHLVLLFRAQGMSDDPSCAPPASSAVPSRAERIRTSTGTRWRSTRTT